MIIDKRYGGTYAGNKHPKEDVSITWYETKIALQENKEIYTFVRDEVWNERATYKGNLKEGIQIKPHHVDNPKVFEFIDFIVHQPRDNWIDTFKDSVDLKEKLRVMLKDYKKRKTPLPPHLTNITPPEPNFVGRKEMLKTITEWYKNPEVHIGALIGWGGEGKSAIVRKWYDSLGKDDTSLSPLAKGGIEGGYSFGTGDIKPDGIFWCGFYRNPYLDRFLDSLLDYLAQGRINLNEIKSTWAKVDKINELIQEGEYLIILDGLEEMQQGEEHGERFGCMTHREITEILTSLSDSKAKGLCLITTRYPLTDIKNWEGNTFQGKEVESLSIEDARLLFEKIGVKGSQDDIDATIEEFKGHALSLTLLANYLVEDFRGDIKRVKDIPPFHSDKEAGGKAHRMLSWYAKQLSQEQLAFMKIFSLFRRAVNERDFKGVFRSEMETSMNKPLIDMNLFSFKRMVDNLCDRRLITKGQGNAYSTHPLIKNYFESIFEEEDKLLCHKKIYQYIGTYAPEKPETLEEMQPLFEQVYHGCQADLHQEAFWGVYLWKIQRREEYFKREYEYFLSLKLGAWDANLTFIQNFFPDGDFQKEPLVSGIEERFWLINAAGASLDCLGRLKEAEGLYKKALDLYIFQGDWRNASVSCGNLANLQRQTGNLREAKKTSSEAIQLSRKAKDVTCEYDSTTYFAYTLFLLGDIDTASIEFEKAGELQRRRDPSTEYLCSGRGIFYADYLLAQRKIYGIRGALAVSKENLRICERNNWIDDIDLCHCSLASIYRHLKKFKSAEANVEAAISGAKKTRRQDLEAKSLIELARIKIGQGLYSEAESEINEGLRICQRCGFKLYEPDAEVVLAKVYLAQGEIAKAKEFAQSAYNKAKQMSYYWPQKDAEEILNSIN